MVHETVADEIYEIEVSVNCWSSTSAKAWRLDPKPFFIRG